MPNYDFKTLSFIDFEDLVRDLLQEELSRELNKKITLESFRSGRDQGVDLRSSKTEKNELIIQCKHFAASPTKLLLAHLKKEIPKIKKIEPKRYVLAVSNDLSKKDKDDILDLLKPFCLSTGDIYGKKDL